MKNLKLILAFCLISMMITVNAAGDVIVSNNSITIKKGETQKFTITANNVAGVINIASDNTKIATVDKSQHFFDTIDSASNTEKLDITISGLEVGTSKIVVSLTDVATYDEEELNGERTITVNVVDSSGTSSFIDQPTATPVSPTATPKPSVIENVPKTSLSVSLVIIMGSVLLGTVGMYIIYKSKKNENS